MIGSSMISVLPSACERAVTMEAGSLGLSYCEVLQSCLRQSFDKEMANGDEYSQRMDDLWVLSQSSSLTGMHSLKWPSLYFLAFPKE